MGLWSFVKGAGKKLIGKDDSPEEAINKELADLGLDAKQKTSTFLLKAAKS